MNKAVDAQFIVWRDRAETAEAELDRLRIVIQEACDLLAERTQGSPARSAGHNARLLLERAIATVSNGDRT